MRFQIEHHFDARVERVERLVLDPRVLADLPRFIPGLECVEERERVEDESVIERAVLFCAAFEPPAFAVGITREMACWTERSRWDLRAHRAVYTIEPHVPPQWRARFRGGGIYRIEERGRGRSARIVEGEVVIEAPLVGHIAERYTVARFREHFEGEARLIESWIDRSF